MPKFKVMLTQMVEQIAEIEVEAETWEEAKAKAFENFPGLTANWQEGNDASPVRCWAIADETGRIVYES